MASDTSHKAASSTDPAFRTWNPVPDSADAALLPELGVITSRSRDLARNNGIASGALQTLRDNIIGHVLRLSVQVDYKLLGWDREPAREWGNQVESLFRSWAEEPAECDAAQTLTFLGQTLQALGSGFLNGEALAIVHWIPRRGCLWNTRLQLVEADRLRTPPQLVGDPNVRGGIEVDKFGAPLAYWILRNHPGDRYGLTRWAPDDFERVPARTKLGRQMVIHLHDKERTGQSRGKPAFASVMRQFYLSGRYSAAELDSAVTSSMILGFMEASMSSEDAAAAFHSGGTDGTSYYDDQVKQYKPILQSNTIVPLPPGATYTPNSPRHPNPAFEQFMGATLRHTAAGLNIPYELLMKDFSQTNYSSARAALLEAWRYFLGRRRWLSDYWLKPIYQLWLEEAVKVGAIPAPNFDANRYAYSRARWVFAGRGWVDPVKEATASQLRMDNNISTLEAECAEQGLDYEEVIAQRAREKEMLAEHGLEPTGSITVVNSNPDSEDPAADPPPTGKRAASASMARQQATSPRPAQTINLTLPEQSPPVVNVTVQPAAAPQVKVQNNVAAPEVNVNLPPRKSETVIERDSNGDIVRATQIEKDL